MKNSIFKILGLLFSMSLVLSACGTRDYSDAEAEAKKVEVKAQEEKAKAVEAARVKTDVTWGENINDFYKRYPRFANVAEKATKFTIYGGAGYGLYRLGKWGWVSWNDRKSKKLDDRGRDDSHEGPKNPDSPQGGGGGDTGGGGSDPVVTPIDSAGATIIINNAGSHGDHKINWPKVAKVGVGTVAALCGLALANFAIEAIDTSVRNSVHELLQPPAVAAPATPGQQ